MPDEIERMEKTESWREFLSGPLFKLYWSYGLSSWGDRAWNFASSLALVCIWPNLRLAVLSGLIHCTSILLFGASVGRWVDAVPRKTAAMICLLVNNTSVAISAGFFAACMYYSQHIWPFVILAILFSTLGNIGSMGLSIVITRDWLVTLCQEDPEKLARMNAVLLRINLSAAILSPILAGQIMTSFSVAAGCLLICGWNLVSWIVESLLLNAVHNQAPVLAQKADALVETELPRDDVQEDTFPAEAYTALDGRAKDDEASCLSKAGRGWREYSSHDAFLAGLGLALLYLTVLGLDSITTGYAYKQGIAENVLAAVRSVSAVTGILGSFAFPRLRKAYGLSKTSLLSLTFQTTCNILCVISIVLPGSPMKLETLANFTIFDSHGYDVSNGGEQYQNFSHAQRGCGDDQSADGGLDELSAHDSSHVSIWVFLVGVVLARFGLWTADLSITQIFQETTAETKRGMIGGVQHSLNQTLDLVKSILVILLPNVETFGLLIIVSFTAVNLGLLLLVLYYFKSGRKEMASNNSLRTSGEQTAALQLVAKEDNRGGDEDCL